MTIRTTLPALLLLASHATWAAEPPKVLFMERAQTQASAGQVRSYGVPTTDALGAVQYWDVTIDLAVGDTGKPLGNATVTAVRQPKVRSNRLTPGNYTDPWGNACTVRTSTLADGRQEGSGSCTASNGAVLNFTVTSGDIAGHPFELQLLAAGIDDIAGYRDYNWGVTGATSNGYAGCFWTNWIVAGRQVGDQVVVTSYRDDNVSDCGITLTKAP
jgi:hypothetical protein